METLKLEKTKLLSGILKALNYHDERKAAVDLTILSASAKYAEFSEECQHFERKMGSSLRLTLSPQISQINADEKQIEEWMGG